MEKMQTGRRIITTLPVHGHQNRLIYALTMLLIAKIIIFRLLGIRQGGYNTTQRTVTFPVSFKHPVFAVAGNAVIGHDEAVQTWNYTNTSFYLHEAYREGAHWVAFGLG